MVFSKSANPRNHTVTVRLSDDEASTLDALATHKDTSRSDTVRDAIVATADAEGVSP